MTTSRRGDISPEGEARMEALFERLRRSFVDNLETIDAATRHLATDALGEAERTEAETAAHRLVGAAAMVGFPEATVPARRLEAVLGGDEVCPADAALLQAEADELRAILLGVHRRCS